MAGEVRITVTPGGPYRVEGDLELRDQDGNPIATGDGTVLLCRCGRSASKPFCDGTQACAGSAAAAALTRGRADLGAA